MIFSGFFGLFLPADPADGRIAALTAELAAARADRDEALQAVSTWCERYAAEHSRANTAEHLAEERRKSLDQVRQEAAWRLLRIGEVEVQLRDALVRNGQLTGKITQLTSDLTRTRTAFRAHLAGRPQGNPPTPVAGVAVYADMAETPAVWFPDAGEGPDRIVVGSGKG